MCWYCSPDIYTMLIQHYQNNMSIFYIPVSQLYQFTCPISLKVASSDHAMLQNKLWSTRYWSSIILQNCSHLPGSSSNKPCTRRGMYILKFCSCNIFWIDPCEISGNSTANHLGDFLELFVTARETESSCSTVRATVGRPLLSAPKHYLQFQIYVVNHKQLYTMVD